MKTIFVLLFATAISVYANEPNSIRIVNPKWTSRDVWLIRLQKDMPAATVKKYLGEPKLETEGSSGAVWYYQSIPVVSYDKGKYEIKCPRAGYISFYRKKINEAKLSSQRRSVLTGRKESFAVTGPTGREALLVDRWNEPEWDKITDTEPNIPPEKHTRKPKKWEDEKNWARLSIGLTDNSIRQILGPPLQAIMNGDGERWYYQKIPACPFGGFYGTINFRDKKVEGWECPFWPEVNKDLCK